MPMMTTGREIGEKMKKMKKQLVRSQTTEDAYDRIVCGRKMTQRCY